MLNVHIVCDRDDTLFIFVPENSEGNSLCACVCKDSGGKAEEMGKIWVHLSS